MTTLTPTETDNIGLEQYFAHEGAIVVEVTTTELANLSAGTCCGIGGNTCFLQIGNRFPERKVYSEILEEEGQQVLFGMPMIQCTQEEAEEIEEIASNNGGSLRASGISNTQSGFYEFEIE